MSRGAPSSMDSREFAFAPTPSVEASRKRVRYVDCPICRADHSQYLFHNVGVRFVKCRTCGIVYANPVSGADVNWLDIDGMGQFSEASDRELYRESFDALLGRIAARYEQVEGKPVRKAVLIGRFLTDLGELPNAKRIGLEVIPTSDADFVKLHERANVDWVRASLPEGVQLLVVAELLEATSEPANVLTRLVDALPTDAWIAATYSNAESLPSALLRRHWPELLKSKSTFFTTATMSALFADVGYAMTQQLAYPMTQTAQYVLSKVAPSSPIATLAAHSPIGSLPLPLRTGTMAAVFRRPARGMGARTEKLSIILPVYNEERYVAQVIETVLAKRLRVEKEVIIVESNSKDRTREIVQTFAGRPGVKIVLEDGPQGKGHAVKTGLQAVTGTIVLIQDADFEYDVDDYDALLEPILQHKTSFVLGSRSLGLDDWKVRKFEGSPIKRLMLNGAQVAFAHTYNALYGQHITDVNTMFKVFRSECLEGLDLESDGFNLDIELACKLAANGNSPIEVPVNYVARGFAEGKKISFVRDALPSYYAFFKYRFK